MAMAFVDREVKNPRKTVMVKDYYKTTQAYAQLHPHD